MVADTYRNHPSIRRTFFDQNLSIKRGGVPILRYEFLFGINQKNFAYVSAIGVLYNYIGIILVSLTLLLHVV